MTANAEDLPHKPPLKRPGEKFSEYWHRLTPGQVVTLHAATVWIGITPQSFFNDYLREEPTPDPTV